MLADDSFNRLGDARHPTLAVAARAAREAFSLPFIILLASFAGFGSVARASGFSFELAIVATAGIWGLPGQIALAEQYGAGAGTAAIILAVSLANARFLLMVMSFMPLMRVGLNHRGLEFASAQLLSTFSWAAARNAFPTLSDPLRPIFFMVYGLVCISSALIGTAAGYAGVTALPHSVVLGLLFLNPLFFALVFTDSRERHVIYAVLLGAVAGPVLHGFSPDWGEAAGGLLAGTAGFYLTRSPRMRDGGAP
jgi:predicted branched-subunit amino acid permease